MKEIIRQIMEEESHLLWADLHPCSTRNRDRFFLETLGYDYPPKEEE